MPQKDYNDIAQTGPTFPDVNLVVYPCAALGESANVVNLKLTHLPMLPAEEVKKGLAKSLAVFGDIMDVGISTDTATGFFMGTGYAVLNIQQDPSAFDEQKFQTLSHQISWYESPDDLFHATWNNMPTWCRYIETHSLVFKYLQISLSVFFRQFNNPFVDDLALFTLSPEYIPGNDFISRLLLEDQRVMDIIIKSLIGEHASSSLYCLGRCEWLNKSVSDVLYVPKTENLAPILIEVQHDVNEDFISRAISYCL